MLFRLLPLLPVISLFLSGCAGSGSKIPQSDYLFLDKNQFVRLEPIETGAVDNQHPYRISAEKLTAELTALKANGNLTIRGEASVFTEDQAASLGRDLSAALARARPDQDVTFQSGGRRGIFGRYSRPAFSTGRMFVREGRINLIMGVIQEYPDIDNNALYDNLYPVGTRTQRVESGWDLQPGAGRLEEQRGDWLSFMLDSDSASSTGDLTSGSAEQPQTDKDREAKTDGAAQRLQVLEDLKLKGLITEQEYRAKRQQILDDL